MSIVAPSEISVEATPVMPLDAAQNSAQNGGAHEQARQLLRELEDGHHWEQTDKLARASSIGSHHAPLAALCTEFRRGIHMLRFAMGETIYRPRSSETVPQQTDELVARMRAILNSVDEIHKQRPVRPWNAGAANNEAVSESAGETRGRFSSVFASLRSSLPFFS